jgi:hypothetical protein
VGDRLIGSSLPILEKSEQFPRVICILALLYSHYQYSLYLLYLSTQFLWW